MCLGVEVKRYYTILELEGIPAANEMSLYLLLLSFLFSKKRFFVTQQMDIVILLIENT